MKKIVDGYGHIERTVSILEDVGAQITRNRKYNGLSQAEFGALIGLKNGQISQIEKGKNLTCSTMSKVFGALGYDASLSLEARVSPETKQSLVDDIVLTVSEFAKKHDLLPYQAFRYLDNFGGLDYLMKNHESIKCESLESSIEDIEEICRREGGMI